MNPSNRQQPNHIKYNNTTADKERNQGKKESQNKKEN